MKSQGDGSGREEKPGAGFLWEGVYFVFTPIAQQHRPPIGFAAWQWESFPADPSFSSHLELSSTSIVAAGLPDINALMYLGTQH